MQQDFAEQFESVKPAMKPLRMKMVESEDNGCRPGSFIPKLLKTFSENDDDLYCILSLKKSSYNPKLSS